jgi:hypothetical protein
MKFTNHIGKALAVIYKTEHINNNPDAINNIIRFSKAISFVSSRLNDYIVRKTNVLFSLYSRKILLTFFLIDIMITGDVFYLFYFK